MGTAFGIRDRAGLAVIAFVGTLAAATGTAHADAWSASTSEEFAPAHCTNGGATGGAWCTGRYCDNVALWCELPPTGVVVDYSTHTWSEQFSEENADVNEQSCLLYANGNGACSNRMLNQGICPGGVVTGLACAGRYCDNVTLECSQIVKGYFNGGGCYWTAYQSEEQGQRFFPAGQLAVGAQCRGSYCDDMSFLVCPVVSLCVSGGPAPSGANACVSQICAADPYCCSNAWDGICVGEVLSICNQHC